MNGFPQYREDIAYSHKSRLNTLELCIPRPTTNDLKQVWIVFIHGGAWQDPAINASSFRKAQDFLLKSSEIESIAGFASIDYRLSPYPSHPSDPSSPSDPARNAKHPDHVNDVLEAIMHLQETYRFADRYILVGHSCGATLALQVAMKRDWSSQYESTASPARDVVPPIAILGVEGLYDLPGLVKYHNLVPAYRAFVYNAFGPDEDTWASVSPVSQRDFAASWPGGRLVVLAHSREDELVEWQQVDHMHRTLKTQGWGGAGREGQVKVVELKGKHDQIWQEGYELARSIEATVKLVSDLPR